MLLFALQPVQIPGEVAAKAGTTIVESGVLGALLVVSILANVALVWLAFRVMNNRVDDTKKLADLSEKMVSTFAEVNGTLASLNDANKLQASALQTLTATVNTILLSLLTKQPVLTPPPPPERNSNGGTL